MKVSFNRTWVADHIWDEVVAYFTWRPSVALSILNPLVTLPRLFLLGTFTYASHM